MYIHTLCTCRCGTHDVETNGFNPLGRGKEDAVKKQIIYTPKYLSMYADRTTHTQYDMRSEQKRINSQTGVRNNKTRGDVTAKTVLIIEALGEIHNHNLMAKDIWSPRVKSGLGYGRSSLIYRGWSVVDVETLNLVRDPYSHILLHSVVLHGRILDETRSDGRGTTNNSVWVRNSRLYVPALLTVLAVLIMK